MIKTVIKKVEKSENETKLQDKSKDPSKRNSIDSIPLPDLKLIVQLAKERRNSKEIVVPIVDEKQQLSSELCNAYKFVVNYGIFEQNFEWLPQEVST